MKLRTFLFSACAALAMAAAPAQAEVYLGDADYYGPIPADYGPRAELWNAAPIVAVGIAAAALGAAIYLNVPERHRHNWRNFCHLYNACYKPVHFVRNDWYNERFAPSYRSRRPAHRPRASYTPPRRSPVHAAPAPVRRSPAHAAPAPVRQAPAARAPQHRPAPQARHSGGPGGHRR